MIANRHDDDNYLDLQRRLRDLSTSLQDRLSPVDRRLVEELIDVNEAGLALETIADALAEGGARLDGATLASMTRLADTMEMPANLLERLRPLGVR